MVKGRNAHPCCRSEFFHAQRLCIVLSQPRDRSCCSLNQIAARCNGAQSACLRCPKNAIQDLAVSQGTEKRYVLRRVEKLKHTHCGTEQPDGGLTNDEALTMRRGRPLWNVIPAQNVADRRHVEAKED